MKVITIVFMVLLFGCDRSRLSERQAIIASYSSDVYKLDSGCSYYYIARKPDGSVWLIHPVDDKIESETVIFQSNK